MCRLENVMWGTFSLPLYVYCVADTPLRILYLVLLLLLNQKRTSGMGMTKQPLINKKRIDATQNMFLNDVSLIIQLTIFWFS